MAKINFVQISVSGLTVKQQQAHMDYLVAKEALRAALQEGVPQGKRLVFTEKYGTVAKPGDSLLKVALVAAAGDKPKAEQQTLADFLDAQDNDGLRR